VYFGEILGAYCTDNPDMVLHFRGGVLGSSFPGFSAEGWVLNFYNRMRKCIILMLCCCTLIHLNKSHHSLLY
jgi:hypothetical protein